MLIHVGQFLILQIHLTGMFFAVNEDVRVDGMSNIHEMSWWYAKSTKSPVKSIPWEMNWALHPCPFIPDFTQLRVCNRKEVAHSN